MGGGRQPYGQERHQARQNPVWTHKPQSCWAPPGSPRLPAASHPHRAPRWPRPLWPPLVHSSHCKHSRVSTPQSFAHSLSEPPSSVRRAWACSCRRGDLCAPGRSEHRGLPLSPGTRVSGSWMDSRAAPYSPAPPIRPCCGPSREHRVQEPFSPTGHRRKEAGAAREGRVLAKKMAAALPWPGETSSHPVLERLCRGSLSWASAHHGLTRTALSHQPRCKPTLHALVRWRVVRPCVWLLSTSDREDPKGPCRLLLPIRKTLKIDQLTFSCEYKHASMKPPFSTNNLHPFLK